MGKINYNDYIGQKLNLLTIKDIFRKIIKNNTPSHESYFRSLRS